MQKYKIFERGRGDWEKLGKFLEENDFSCLDMLACVCEQFGNITQKEYQTKIMILGQKFDIKIAKVE